MHEGRAPAAALIDRLERIAELPALLVGCVDVAQLLSHAAKLAAAHVGFSRAVIFSVSGDQLTAEATDALKDPASDRLRRLVLEKPVRLVAGTPEHSAAHAGTTLVPRRGTSELTDRLGLSCPCLAEIAPDGRALALLVLDRDLGAVTREEAALARVCAQMIAVALERAIQAAQIADLSAEMRHLTVSARALMGEIQHAPLALPTRRGTRPEFPLLQTLRPADGPRLQEVLTQREITVATLLAEGLSNGDIAARLVLSPETVKGYVKRIMRKLGAATRVETATTFIALRAGNARGPAQTPPA